MYCNLDIHLTEPETERFYDCVRRRQSGEPVAYITGTQEFFDTTVTVDKHVLIPRPETELLVEESLKSIQPLTSPVICDAGTGSGVIAICLAEHNSRAIIYATDINADSLVIAALNIRNHGLEGRIRLLHCDLLDKLPVKVDLIVANLPYVKTCDLSEKCFEPVVALDGGAGGTDVIERLLWQSRPHLKSGGLLMLEIGFDQQNRIVDLVNRYLPGAAVMFKPDMAGIMRLAVVTT